MKHWISVFTLLVLNFTVVAQFEVGDYITSHFDGGTNIHITDLNNDDVGDVLTYSYNYDLRFFEGVERFQYVYGKTISSYWKNLPKDLDSDGDIDIVCISQDNDSILWLENLGKGESFEIHLVSTSNVMHYHDFQIIDLKGDRSYDLVFIDWYQDSISVIYDIITDSARISNTKIPYNLSNTPHFEAIDINDDNLLDLVINSKSESKPKFQVHFSDNDSVFSSEYDSVVDYMSNINFKDLDQDGDFDLIGVNEDLSLSVYNYSIDSFYALDTTIKTLVGRYLRNVDVEVVDMNNDAYSDLLVLTRYSQYISGVPYYKVQYYLGQGSFSWGDPVEIIPETLEKWGVYNITIDTLDKSNVTFYLSGEDEILKIGLTDSLTVEESHSITANIDHPLGMEILDVDSDGDQDVVVAAYKENQLVWYENRNEQIRVKHILKSDLPYISDVAKSDFDNDGDLDLLTVSDHTNRDARLTILINDSGSFVRDTIIATGNYYYSQCEVFDYNQDGYNDILVITQEQGYGGTYIYYGQGGFNFSSASRSTDYMTDRIHIADVDNDNDLDLLSISKYHDYVGLKKNGINATGSSEHAISWDIDSPIGYGVLDFGKDDDLDVVVGDYTDLLLYENSADGATWTKKVIDELPSSISAIKSIDFDGDSDLDLIVATYYGMYFYENFNGYLSNRSLIDNSGITAHSIEVGDLNGDGNLDFLVSDYIQNKVAWFSNKLGTDIRTIDTVFACREDSSLIHGNYESLTNSYYNTISINDSIDSLSIITLLYYDPVDYYVLDTLVICRNDSVEVFGKFETAEGLHYDTVPSIRFGCDSVNAYYIDFYPHIPNTHLAPIKICEGDSIEIFGKYESEKGYHRDTLTSINGCDSIILQYVMFYQTIPTVFLDSNTICNGDSLLWRGEYISVAGYHYDTLSSVEHGCDSIVSTYLSFYDSIPTTIEDTLYSCFGDSIEIYNQFQSLQGLYFDTLQSINGCDSIIGTYLTNYSSVDTFYYDTINICYSPDANPIIEYIFGGDSLIYGNLVYDGTYTKVLRNINGCDSILVQEVTIDTMPEVTMSLDTDYQICHNLTEFDFSNYVEPKGGEFYSWGINDYSISSTGVIYPNQMDVEYYGIIYYYGDKCVSSVQGTFMIDICLNVEEVENEKVTIYPNPFEGELKVDISNAKNARIRIVDLLGRGVLGENVNEGQYIIDQSRIGKGVFFLSIQDESGSVIYHSKIISK